MSLWSLWPVKHNLDPKSEKILNDNYESNFYTETIKCVHCNTKFTYQFLQGDWQYVGAALFYHILTHNQKPKKHHPQFEQTNHIIQGQVMSQSEDAMNQELKALLGELNELEKDPELSLPELAVPEAEKTGIFQQKIMLGLPGTKEGDVIIGPLDQLSIYKKICIFGPPGSGKTVLAASAPRPIFLDIEQGTISLENHPELKAKALVVPIRRWAQMQTIMNLFMDGTHPLVDMVDTICVDTFSEGQRKVLDEQISRRGPEAFMPVGGDYNENTQRMRRFATFLRDLEKNFILVCHVKTEDTPTGQYLRPDLTPVLLQSVVGMMDLVGYMYSVESPVGEDGIDTVTTRYLQIWPTQHVLAKSRLGGLPKVIVNPTFDMIMNAKKVVDEVSNND